MDELKAYNCPQCSGHYTPSPDNEPSPCDYCGTFLEVTGEVAVLPNTPEWETKIRNVYKEKFGIEARLKEPMTPDERYQLENELDIVKEYINTVLPKITEMTAYFPELVGESFEGTFFKGALEEHLQRCDERYTAMTDYTRMSTLARAIKVLQDNGVPVPDLSPTTT